MCRETSILASNKHIGYIFRHAKDFSNNSHTSIASSLSVTAGGEDGYAKIEIVNGQCNLDQSIRPAWYNSSFQRSVSKYGRMHSQMRLAILQGLPASYCEFVLGKSGFSIQFKRRERRSTVAFKNFHSPEALSMELRHRMAAIRIIAIENLDKNFFSVAWCEKMLKTSPAYLMGAISYDNVQNGHKIWCS